SPGLPSGSGRRTRAVPAQSTRRSEPSGDVPRTEVKFSLSGGGGLAPKNSRPVAWATKSVTWSSGPLGPGGPGMTVIHWLHSAVLPEASVATQVTVVVPTGYGSVSNLPSLR